MKLTGIFWRITTLYPQLLLKWRHRSKEDGAFGIWFSTQAVWVRKKRWDVGHLHQRGWDHWNGVIAKDFCIQPLLACPLSGNVIIQIIITRSFLTMVASWMLAMGLPLLIQTWRSLAWEAFDLVLKTHWRFMRRTVPINGDITTSRWWFQIFFISTPKLGEYDFHFDDRIFFKWVGKNHQLDNLWRWPYTFIGHWGEPPPYWGPCPPSPLPCWSWIPTNVQLHERHGSPRAPRFKPWNANGAHVESWS